MDYAEFLDDAVVDAWELKESLSWGEDEDKSEEERSEEQSTEREWWVLKPGMSDGANGIRLFSTEAQLRRIFEAWDPPDSDDESDPDDNVDNTIGNGVITSQLRHFVAQRYIHPPVLQDAKSIYP